MDDGSTTFAVTITQNVKHAEDVAKAMVESRKWTAPGRELTVVSIGGDGLIHEIVNGLLSAIKSSSTTLPKITLGIVPAGSGNAIATTLGITTPEYAAFHIIKGHQTVALKVASVHVGQATVEGSRIRWAGATDNELLPPILKYSLVVVSWGLHAQIVRQSESLRMLGNKRFKVAAYAQIALNQQYPGVLYLQDAQILDRAPSNASTEPHFTPIGNASNSSDVLFQPHNGDDGKVTNFSYFVSTKQSSLEPGFKIAPHAHPSQPTLDLVLCTSPDRSHVIEMLTKAGQGGAHASLPFVHYVRTKGWTLLPSTAAGRSKQGLVERVVGGKDERVHDLCVDGEMVQVEDGGAVWVRTVEGELGNVLNVFC
ncbi:hypothetical protein HDV00_005778 [Rhizophlyctis rosea]|nr:hypothetical protein HDV00_005778 [Rhizophlyctis rosea]